jgi:hypothetical protein
MNTNSGSLGSLASATPLRLIVMVALCLAVAGCTVKAGISSKPDEFPVDRLNTFGPDEHGVVCYAYRGYGISCVRVR